jgi:hypothetical protein
VDGRVVFSDVVRGDLKFVGFSRIFLLGNLIFKGLIARSLNKSFGVKVLITRNVIAYTEYFWELRVNTFEQV